MADQSGLVRYQFIPNILYTNEDHNPLAISPLNILTFLFNFIFNFNSIDRIRYFTPNAFSLEISLMISKFDKLCNSQIYLLMF